jgi:hypothetical protein
MEWPFLFICLVITQEWPNFFTGIESNFLKYRTLKIISLGGGRPPMGNIFFFASQKKNGFLGKCYSILGGIAIPSNDTQRNNRMPIPSLFWRIAIPRNDTQQNNRMAIQSLGPFLCNKSNQIEFITPLNPALQVPHTINRVLGLSCI